MTVRLAEQFGWIGLDFGAKRTGVARSRYGKIAEPFGQITGSLTEQTAQLCQLLDDWRVTTVVVGCPRHAPADHPVRVAITNLFEALAERPAVNLVIQAEDLTTKEAERQLSQTSRRRHTSDTIAAQLILQDFLDHHLPSEVARN